MDGFTYILLSVGYGLHGVRCSFQGSRYMHVISTGVQL